MEFPELKEEGQKAKFDGGKWSMVTDLTKREYFAGIALNALCSNPSILGLGTGYWIDNKSNLPKMAIELADELIKQLEKK